MLVILGGSSPWTVVLLRRLDIDQVLLVGRDQAALRALQAFSKHRVRPKVHISTQVEESLSRASAILCQARIGGWQGRAADEAQAQRWGALGDETVGIGGVRSAMRAKASIARWARVAQGVPVVMFTNPTDLLTRLWRENSGGHCVSVCEIPTQMLRRLPPGSKYLGVNHLGIAVAPDGSRHLSRWLRIADDLVHHVSAQRESPPVRAKIVHGLTIELREAIAQQDEQLVDRVLALRYPHWHELLVVPVLESLLTGRRFRGVVGLPNGDRLPAAHPEVIVESTGSTNRPEPLDMPDHIIEEVTRLAHARQLAWECIMNLSPHTLKRLLAVDPFTVGVGYAPDLLAWLSTESAMYR